MVSEQRPSVPQLSLSSLVCRSAAVLRTSAVGGNLVAAVLVSLGLWLAFSPYLKTLSLSKTNE